MIFGPHLRKFLLALHVSVSVGWIGAVAAYLALDVTAAMDPDVQTLRAAYIAMGIVTWWAIVPLAFASFLSGVIISLGTKWGLFRHYWVVISFLLTLVAVIVLIVETRVIDGYFAVASDPSSSDAQLRGLGTTLPHSVGGLVVLVVVMVLNMYKPRGLTPYGWRKQQEERAGAIPDPKA